MRVAASPVSGASRRPNQHSPAAIGHVEDAPDGPKENRVPLAGAADAETLDVTVTRDARRRRCVAAMRLSQARVGVGTENRLHSHVRGRRRLADAVVRSHRQRGCPDASGLTIERCAACMSQATPRRESSAPCGTHFRSSPLARTLVGTPPFKELAEGLIERTTTSLQSSHLIRSGAGSRRPHSPGPECARTRRTPCSRCGTCSDFSCATCPGTRWHTCLGRGGDASR
jgi:hypothetical protein